MLIWAILFFAVALLGALFGFGGIAAAAAGIGKLIFFPFLILAAVALVLALTRRPAPSF